MNTVEIGKMKYIPVWAMVDDVPCMFLHPETDKSIEEVGDDWDSSNDICIEFHSVEGVKSLIWNIVNGMNTIGTPLPEEFWDEVKNMPMEVDEGVY